MFIDGAKEWMGRNAHTFLFIRTVLEQKLISMGYEYFYGGIISKRSIYEKHSQILGSTFAEIFIEFLFGDERYILSPEYTFRVYEYLDRNKLLRKETKVFYSQEMMRNESFDEIKRGKTFSFWQVGYEIFGQDDTLLAIESMNTLCKCLQELPLKNVYFRVTDKRILNALFKQHSMENDGRVLEILEACNEDADAFYLAYTKQGGNKKFAEKLRRLMRLASDRELTFSILKAAVTEKEGREGIENLETIHRKILDRCGKKEIVLLPFMAKTWDAYTTFIFDARVIGYDKAIAGGGNLLIDPTNSYCMHSGAGIGVTRIAENVIPHQFLAEHEFFKKVKEDMVCEEKSIV